MVQIMDHCQKYVPTMTSQCTYKNPNTGEEFGLVVDDFHHILLGMFTREFIVSLCTHGYICYMFSGGDQLTTARARGSKRTCANGLRGVDRLEGITPVTEDWHAKVCLLHVRLCHKYTLKLCVI